jgi:hypothetical protein
MLFSKIIFEILTKPNAYLDPGSGSFIVQMLIAGIVGAGFLLRGFWSKLFRKKSDLENDENEFNDDLEE